MVCVREHKYAETRDTYTYTCTRPPLLLGSLLEASARRPKSRQTERDRHTRNTRSISVEHEAPPL